MLQAGAHTKISRSHIQNCTALAGGGVCTAMADDVQKGGMSTEFDRQTQLSFIDTKFSGNTGGDIVAGPYFELMFSPCSTVNLWSDTVQYWHRLCGLGYHLSKSSGFCDQCPANTYSMQSVEGTKRGHNNTECSNAPLNGYAPGGAVLIANSAHWHHPRDSLPGSTGPYTGCTDCHEGDPWKPALRMIRRWVLGHMSAALEAGMHLADVMCALCAICALFSNVPTPSGISASLFAGKPRLA